MPATAPRQKSEQNMKLKVLGSSSDGNGYILEGERDALFIEAGVSFRTARQRVDLDKVRGLLVTHQHTDHSKYIKDYAASGFPCVAPAEVWEARAAFTANSYNTPAPFGSFDLGDFNVMVIPAHHDVPTVGYIISHPELGRLLFLTDSRTMATEEGAPLVINGLNHIMIECNYSFEHLEQAIIEGRTQLFQKERIIRTHMEVGTTIDTLLSMNLSTVSEVILLHLSSNNNKEEYCRERVVKSIGKEVYVAQPGLEVELITIR